MTALTGLSIYQDLARVVGLSASVAKLCFSKKQTNLPYITNAERIGRKKGKQEGRQ
jgi:hypothetical protein